MLALRLCGGAFRHSMPPAGTQAIRTVTTGPSQNILKFPKINTDSKAPVSSNHNVTRGEMRKAPFLEKIVEQFAGQEVSVRKVSVFVKGLLSHEPINPDSKVALFGALMRDVERIYRP